MLTRCLFTNDRRNYSSKDCMNWSFFRKFITFIFCWMQCTHQFSHIRKYQCIKRCDENFINMTKLLVLSYNRFDVAIVYFIIYVIVIIFNELIANQFFYQLQWFRFQIFRINLHSTSNTNIFIHIESLIETTRYIDQKLKTLNNFLVSISLLQDFRVSNIFKSSIISFTRRYHDSCLAIRFRTEIRKRFHLFYFVFVLITNEHRMHVQRFAKKNVFSLYKMTWYFCVSRLF